MSSRFYWFLIEFCLLFISFYSSIPFFVLRCNLCKVQVFILWLVASVAFVNWYLTSNVPERELEMLWYCFVSYTPKHVSPASAFVILVHVVLIFIGVVSIISLTS